MAKDSILRARELLRNLTPLKMNCGRLCGGACCQDDETGENGMLLFPGEEALYARPIEGFPFRLADDDTLFPGGKRLICQGHCPREQRPLACRLFPLRVRISGGRAVAEIDPRAWCVCPLPEQGGLRAMSGAFVEAVKKAGDLLLADPPQRAALESEQKLLDEMRQL